MTHPFETETFEQRRDRIIAQADELEWQHKRLCAERALAGEIETEPRRLSLVEPTDTPTRIHKGLKRQV